jgi:hypothetical protein
LAIWQHLHAAHCELGGHVLDIGGGILVDDADFVGANGRISDTVVYYPT